MSALGGAVQEVAARNPLDLLAGATAERFDATLPLVLGDEGIDEVIVECVATTATDVTKVAKVVAAARGYQQKPIVACLLGKHGAEEARAALRAASVPVYALPESAAAALRAGLEHATASRLLPEPSAGSSRLEARLPPCIGATEGWLTASQAGDLLRSFGLNLLPTELVRGGDEAIQAAESIGWPVALKVSCKGVLHKSDVGGVALGVSDPSAVWSAIDRFRWKLEEAGRADDLEGILVQPMAPRGVEMFLGATRDARFGVAIAFGTGGVQLELWNDVVVRVGPVSSDEAELMIASIKGSKLLDGYRGGPRGDRAALAGAIAGVSRLMEAVPEIMELDLNPLLALEPGRGVVAVDARVRVCPTAALEGARP